MLSPLQTSLKVPATSNIFYLKVTGDRYMQHNRDTHERSDDDEQHGLDTKVGQVAEKFQITVEILVLIAITRFVMREKDESNCGHF